MQRYSDGFAVSFRTLQKGEAVDLSSFIVSALALRVTMTNYIPLHSVFWDGYF
jgi:hypothetical protein